MSFAEVDLFGVYVAPISITMVAAWLVTIAPRRIANRLGLFRYAWHPTLFVFAVYIIVLSAWILIASWRGSSSTLIDVTSKHGRAIDDGAAAVSPTPESGVPARRRVHIGRFLVTLAVLALAGALGSAAWGLYMGAPWTRDATVRAHVIALAPEVAGRIVELPVADNQYVRKGDLLMTIDPTNYTIAGSQAEAAVQQAHASIDNIDAQIGVQQAQINASQAQLDRARAALVFAQQQAARGLSRELGFGRRKVGRDLA